MYPADAAEVSTCFLGQNVYYDKVSVSSQMLRMPFALGKGYSEMKKSSNGVSRQKF